MTKHVDLNATWGKWCSQTLTLKLSGQKNKNKNELIVQSTKYLRF